MLELQNNYDQMKSEMLWTYIFDADLSITDIVPNIKDLIREGGDPKFEMFGMSVIQLLQFISIETRGDFVKHQRANYALVTLQKK